jgi:hypothetical protein
MALRKKKQSRKDQIADLAISYLKIKTASKAVKGAGKAAKGTAVYTATKKSRGGLKKIPVVIGAGIAAIVATKVVRGRSHSDPATA